MKKKYLFSFIVGAMIVTACIRQKKKKSSKKATIIFFNEYDVEKFLGVGA